MTIRSNLLLIFLFLLGGCGHETLYSNLDEQQANEMLAILLSQDIDARKTGLDKKWNLQIPRPDLPRAIALLKHEGYPRQDFESLGDIFKKEGFVSSPMEERARLLHALSQELSNTLSTIDGVVTARVHLAIPERRVLSDETAPSSASVFIKYTPDSEVANQAASIKALVVNSIEGLPYDNVTVTFFVTSQQIATYDKTVSTHTRLAGFSRQATLFAAGMILIICIVALMRRPWARKTEVILRRNHDT